VFISVKFSENKSVQDGEPVTSSKLDLKCVKDGIQKMKSYYEDTPLAKLKSNGGDVNKLTIKEIKSILVRHFPGADVPKGKKATHVKALTDAIAANASALASVMSAAEPDNDVHVEVRAPVGPKVKLFGLEFASRDICLAFVAHRDTWATLNRESINKIIKSEKVEFSVAWTDKQKLPRFLGSSLSRTVLTRIEWASQDSISALIPPLDS